MKPNIAFSEVFFLTDTTFLMWLKVVHLYDVVHGSPYGDY